MKKLLILIENNTKKQESQKHVKIKIIPDDVSSIKITSKVATDW